MAVAPKFDETMQSAFIGAIARLLKVQQAASGGRYPEDPAGNINRAALGYIYGFIDAALQSIGQDMADTSLGVPITYQILTELFQDRAERYMTFLIDSIGHDLAARDGVLTGGRQYIDFNKPNAKGAPMGLARYLLRASTSVCES